MLNKHSQPPAAPGAGYATAIGAALPRAAGVDPAVSAKPSLLKTPKFWEGLASDEPIRGWLTSVAHWLTMNKVPRADAVGTAANYLRGKAQAYWFSVVDNLRHDAIAVFVDKLSKMVRLAPCHKTDGALDVANMFVDNVFRSHSVPKTLLSDRDPRFTSDLFREISKLLGVKQAMSTAFHPQTDGQTKRVNQVVEEMLRHFVHPRLDDWDTYLALVEFAINNTYQELVGTPPSS